MTEIFMEAPNLDNMFWVSTLLQIGIIGAVIYAAHTIRDALKGKQ